MHLKSHRWGITIHKQVDDFTAQCTKSDTDELESMIEKCNIVNNKHSVITENLIFSEFLSGYEFTYTHNCISMHTFVNTLIVFKFLCPNLMYAHVVL